MKTLYLRIVVTTIIVMIFSSILAFILSNVYYQYSLKPYNDKKVTEMAQDIVTFYEQNPTVHLDEYLVNIGELGYQIYLTDEQGHELFYGGEFKQKNIDTSIVQNVLNGQVYHGISKFPSKAFITGFFDNSLINSIGIPIEVDGDQYALFLRPNIELQFGEMRIFFSLLVVLIIFLSILFVVVSTRYIVKPISKLTDATKEIAKGKYNIQLNVNRQDEIGKLASHFSQMARNLEQLEEMRQEFVSNVSHEIQSPLASIQGFSQSLQRENITENQRNHYLSIIENESRRMSSLSKQLLTLASLDKEEGILVKSTFDVSEQIKQVVSMTEWSWREKELAIEMDLPSTFIYADKNFLHQVWTNLITNSIKFTNAGGTISLCLKTMDEQCVIAIKDTGIGISESDLPHIFHRFYKSDKARSRNGSGTGLGLAITKKVIGLHDGNIHVESSLGKGTTFHIRLPRM
ncbi:sensor histidine kinase [Metabacillus bambusae]|uniref:Heme sensor protein HssS n=1 Tax=Metabacillus bambusae TaxID=2795218 RepID=A0ABS3N629_9BACI|nr:HAMP domain-containing sensor histidine kinase [Metabacillus bambusae]MBO1513750.1 HAMP domain-containing protein [Metabacillus bambusae]